jgi:stage II sporulation protein AA (anti-sigma F factor antagonist)
MTDGAFAVDTSALGGLTVVAVRGEVDMATAQLLADQLCEIDDDIDLAVDLSAVGFMDSTGLRVLLVKAGSMRGRGGSLHISAASAQVRRLLQHTNLTSLLEADGDLSLEADVTH